MKIKKKSILSSFILTTMIIIRCDCMVYGRYFNDQMMSIILIKHVRMIVKYIYFEGYFNFIFQFKNRNKFPNFFFDYFC